MSNPMLSFQLTSVYDQLVLPPRRYAPPLGFAQFTPRYRQAFYCGRAEEPRIKNSFKLRALICPGCRSPRNMNDRWGWVWIIGDEPTWLESGYLSECQVCRGFAWSPNMIEVDPRLAFFRPSSKGDRRVQPDRYAATSGSL